MKTKILSVIGAGLAITIICAGCTSGLGGYGVGSGNTPAGTVKVVDLGSIDGSADVAVDNKFQYTFSKDVDTSTVTTSTYFILPTPIANIASPLKGAYDSGACDVTSALPATVDCYTGRKCVLTPSSSLSPSTSYTACLTPGILYAGTADAFPGAIIQFTTKAAGISTYTIGGTVTGLSVGDTLVLQNSGADDLSITADGTFTFATAVADLTAYAVTVFTKPAAKTCTVSSGTGTVSGANVANVSVVCSVNAYTIGGTVSGLGASEEVVLQNNSADDLTITADGLFTFATAVADGGGYAVTVLTKPANRTCTVSNGTGTVSGANVTNVTVVCSANAYTVGGTVSGLTGTVVLQNNSSDDLSISANGSFTFATAVADGAEYEVTVKTQPVGQTCTVANGTGTIAGANVTNVNVVCLESGLAQWAMSVTAGGYSADFNGVSVDADGNIYAVGYIEGTGVYTFAAEVTVNGAYGSYNVVIVKYNSSGTAQWAKSVTEGADVSYFYGVSVDDTSGNIYAVGSIYGTGDYDFGGSSDVINGTAAGSNSVVIVKYDSSGTAQWAKTVTGANYSYFYGVSVDDTSGNIYAVGSINGTGNYDFGSGVIAGATLGSNVVIVKYNSSGTAQWAKTVTGASSSHFDGVSVDTSGNIYAVGSISGTGDYNFGSGVIVGAALGDNVVIVKYAPDDGTAQWAKTVTEGADVSEFFGVSVDTSGNIYAVGYTNYNVVIVKYDPDDGTAQWAKTVEAGSESYFTGVSVDTSGNIYAVGYINGTEDYDFGGSSDVIKGTYDGDNVVVVKYDPDDGTAQWAKTVEAGGSDSYFRGISVDDTSGNIYAVGYIAGDGDYDFGSGVIAGTAAVSNVVIVKYTK